MSSPYEYDQEDEIKAIKFKQADLARKQENRIKNALRTKDINDIMELEDEV